MKVSVSEYFYSNWLKKRHELNPIELTHSNIYILPSKLGALFIGFTLILFVVGVNYQNNLLLFSSYFFALIQLLAFFSSFKNLHALRLEVVDVAPVFSPNRPSIRAKFTSVKPQTSLCLIIGEYVKHIDFKGTSYTEDVVLPFTQRGLYQIPRLAIQSTYPYGLVKAFSYWAPPLKVYVYPELSLQTGQSVLSKQHSDDLEYQGVKAFNGTDNPVRISWKHYARTGELQVKRFENSEISHTDRSVQLNYFDESGDKEQRLSVLSTKLKHAFELKYQVTLHMPGKKIYHCVDEKTFCTAWEALSEF